MKQVLLILFLSVLSACSATGPLYTEVTQAESKGNQALVYVYRIKQLKGSGVKSRFLDNGEDKGAINVGGYTSYYAEPGIHRVHTDTTGIDEPLEVSMEAGKTYYFRVDYNPGTWTGTFNVIQMQKNSALPELEQTHYQGK